MGGPWIASVLREGLDEAYAPYGVLLDRIYGLYAMLSDP